MKYSELVEYFKGRELSVIRSPGVIHIGEYYSIHEDDEISINYPGVYTSKDLEDLQVIHRYISTPSEDRGVTKLFKLRLPYTSNKDRYLQVSKFDRGNIRFSRATSTDYWIGQFTEESMKSLVPEKLLSILIPEEVANEN